MEKIKREDEKLRSWKGNQNGNGELTNCSGQE